jgi:hypothetical protein
MPSSRRLREIGSKGVRDARFHVRSSGIRLQLTSSDKDVLMRQGCGHLKEVRNVRAVAQTLLGYLGTAGVTTTPGR